ncbi:PEP-CTERM sorting domain-containing protein [Lusitaniella coriacea]|uniref:PEP-CTERM sorting domain-containing protein n=1 Tax=Lusitaniella coriacea TaxID=1983105 RepID=UPI003CF29D2E
MSASLLQTVSTRLLGATACIGVLAAAPVQAQTVISGWSTGGDDMVGMEITVDFLNGNSQTSTWGALGDTWGATGSGWALTKSSSSTYGNPWALNVNEAFSITSLTINAVPGNTMFDLYRNFTDDNGVMQHSTPRSADGWTFETVAGQAPDSFDYSTPIDVSVGDLFGTLSLLWEDGFWGTMQFITDTDNGTAGNPVQVADSTPNPDPFANLLTQFDLPTPPAATPQHPAVTPPPPTTQSVPEPTSVLTLLAIGVMGLGTVRKGQS